MRRGWLLLIYALLSVFVVFGQGADERAYMKRAEFEQWQNRELKSERFQQLPYRIAHFKGSGNAPALVVWIHGGHSCGEDNQSHIGDHYGAISKLAAQLVHVSSVWLEHCSLFSALSRSRQPVQAL